MDLVELLRIDTRPGKPLFDQLKAQVIDAVRAGRLPAGSKLPTVRELAGRLNLAVNTVARAYRELEAAGIVETRRRLGTFVAGTDPTDATMVVAARSYATAARSLGLGKGEALRYLEAVFDD